MSVSTFTPWLKHIHLRPFRTHFYVRSVTNYQSATNHWWVISSLCLKSLLIPFARSNRGTYSWNVMGRSAQQRLHDAAKVVRRIPLWCMNHRLYNQNMISYELCTILQQTTFFIVFPCHSLIFDSKSKGHIFAPDCLYCARLPDLRQLFAPLHHSDKPQVDMVFFSLACLQMFYQYVGTCFRYNQSSMMMWGFLLMTKL